MNPTAHPPCVLPPERARLEISDRIHEAVCEATGTDGERLCAVYAAVTRAVMERLTGERHVLQAGMLAIELSATFRAANPTSYTHMTMDGRPRTPGGRSRAADPLPEFHAWCGRIHRTRAGAESDPSQHELIDTSARHYRSLVAPFDRGWPGPGDFDSRTLWVTGDQLPDGITLVPDFQTTVDVLARLTAEPLRGIVLRATGRSLDLLGDSYLRRAA